MMQPEAWKRPSTLTKTLAVLSLIAYVVTILVVALLGNPDEELVRSHPNAPYVLAIFHTTEKVVLTYSCISAVVLSLGAIFVRKSKTSVESRFDNAILNAYSEDRASVQLLFSAFVGWLLSALAFPYIAFLVVSPWPIYELRPLYSSADKRWLIVFYNYIWIGLLVASPLLYRLLEWIYQGTPASECDKPAAPRNRVFRHNRPWVETLCLALIAITLATLIYGPPWNISNSPRPINSHLAESMASIQAIATGSTAYVGNASFGYGPGTQLAVYLYQKFNGGLGLINLREAYAFIHLGSATLLFSFFLIVFRARYSVIVIILLVSFSPLSLYEIRDNGEFVGLFGWANAARYLAIPVVTLLTVRLIWTYQQDRRFLLRSLTNGAIWGALAYFSQENGILTAFSIASILVAAYVGKIVPSREALAIFLSTCAGGLLFFCPILLFYFFKGSGSEFIENYRLMPGYAFAGVTGLYDSSMDAHTKNYYYAMPVIALIAGTFAFLKTKPLGFIGEITIERLLVIAAALSILMPHLSGVIRTANSQIINGSIGFPILFALLLFQLTNQRNLRFVVRALAVVSLLALTALIVPHHSYPHIKLETLSKLRLKSFETNRQLDETRRAERLPKSIATLDEAFHSPIGVSGKDLVNLVSQLNQTIGNKTTYIDVHYRISGALFFLADLTPSSLQRDMNSRYPTQRSRFQHIDDTINSISQTEALVTTNLESKLAEAYLSENIDSEIQTINLSNETYYILMKRR